MDLTLINTMIQIKKITTLEQLCQYFDQVIDLENDDLLFASSYLRGFIEVAAVKFGDDSQLLSTELAQVISLQLADAKHELNDLDSNLVENFWLSILPLFNKK